MVNVFGERADAGGSNANMEKFMHSIKLLKQVTITSGRYSDYIDQIQDSYRLGFTPYRVQQCETV